MGKLLINHFTAASALMLLALMTGCSTTRVPGIYRIDVQQGNVVTQDMLDKLESGMDKRKVRFILGTPLIVDAFQSNRWDYIYTFQEGSGDRMQRRISVFFENERLTRIDGDIKAAQSVRVPKPAPETMVSVPDSELDEGLFSGLTHGFEKESPAQPEHKDEKIDKQAKTPESVTPATQSDTVSKVETAEPVSSEPSSSEATSAPEDTPAPDDEQPGFFARLKERLTSSDEEASTAAQPVSTDSSSTIPPASEPPSAESTVAIIPETSSEEAHPPAGKSTDADEADKPGFFESLKRRFSKNTDTESSAKSEDVSPSDEVQEKTENARKAAESEGSSSGSSEKNDEDGGFFKRLMRRLKKASSDKENTNVDPSPAQEQPTRE